jgi:hypothetical protein
MFKFNQLCVKRLLKFAKNKVNENLAIVKNNPIFALSKSNRKYFCNKDN